MSRFESKELLWHEILGGILILAGAGTALACGWKTREMTIEDFWWPYWVGFKGFGLMMLLVGVVWTVLSVLRNRTRLLSSETSLDADQFIINGVVALAVTGAICLVIYWRWPMVPANQWPVMAPEELAGAKRAESNLRLLALVMITLFGFTIAGIQFLRFVKPQAVAAAGEPKEEKMTPPPVKNKPPEPPSKKRKK